MNSRATLTRRAVLALTAGAFFTSSARAETAPDVPGGRALVLAAYDQARVPLMNVRLEITIQDGKRSWVRTATRASKQGAWGDQKQVFTFRSPAELDGSAVLTRETGGDAAQWVYIPAYHASRRIPPANSGEAYLGTDYYYEDVLDRRWGEYQFRDLGVEALGQARLTLVEAVPNSELLKAHSAYSRTVFWIEPVRRVVVREEYFGRDGALLKRLSNNNLKPYGNRLLWDGAVMENVRTGHKTVSVVLKRELDVELPDKLFTERALKEAR